MISSNASLSCSVILQHKILTNCIWDNQFFWFLYLVLFFSFAKNHVKKTQQLDNCNFRRDTKALISPFQCGGVRHCVLHTDTSCSALLCKPLSSPQLGPKEMTKRKDISQMGLQKNSLGVCHRVHPRKFSEQLSLLANLLKILKP